MNPSVDYYYWQKCLNTTDLETTNFVPKSLKFRWSGEKMLNAAHQLKIIRNLIKHSWKHIWLRVL